MNVKRTMAVLLVLLGALFCQDAQAFYNPSTGRWLTRDPASEQGGINLYATFLNCPLSNIDRFGLVTGTFGPQIVDETGEPMKEQGPFKYPYAYTAFVPVVTHQCVCEFMGGVSLKFNFDMKYRTMLPKPASKYWIEYQSFADPVLYKEWNKAGADYRSRRSANLAHEQLHVDDMRWLSWVIGKIYLAELEMTYFTDEFCNKIAKDAIFHVITVIHSGADRESKALRD